MIDLDKEYTYYTIIMHVHRVLLIWSKIQGSNELSETKPNISAYVRLPKILLIL